MARHGLNLADLGEDALLRRLLAGSPQGNDLVVPPGDDCAAVETGDRNNLLLLKTDCIVEGVHYLPETPPPLVGRKALARAISDIAAMGGSPRHALITILTPPSSPVSYWEDVYKGISSLAAAHQISLAGGETSSCPHRAISVSLTGTVPRKHLRTRSGGRPGDILLVTGRLGGSLISGRHLRFSPRLAEGRWLASQKGVHAMMDLSDGLAADLPRLAAASGTGWQLEKSSLPRHRGCSHDNALHDGEDYELLLAVSPSSLSRLLKDWRGVFPNTPLTPVGSLTPPSSDQLSGRNGGFDHFRIASPRSAC
ncbi:MAG: thiamine-phosphate kinase [Terrimicrobiaceae bacterium]